MKLYVCSALFQLLAGFSRFFKDIDLSILSAVLLTHVSCFVCLSVCLSVCLCNLDAGQVLLYRLLCFVCCPAVTCSAVYSVH